MRALALLVVLGCADASAEDAVRPHRGWITGAGLMLAGGGAVALSLGAYDALQGEAAAQTVRAYYANGAAPTASEASTVRWLQERSERMGFVGLTLVVSGGAALVLGISMVLLDGLVGGTGVSLAVQPGLGAVRFSGTF